MSDSFLTGFDDGYDDKEPKSLSSEYQDGWDSGEAYRKATEKEHDLTE